MLAVLGASVPDSLQKAVSAQGFAKILLPPHPGLPEPVCTHPDMLLFFAPDGIFCTESYVRVAKEVLARISGLTGLPILPVPEEYGPAYPKDILFNSALVGTVLYCNATHTAKRITEHPGFRVVPVRQGYAKCSVIPVGSDALMTGDPSIAAAAEAVGQAVLRLPVGGIRLSGYPFGFWGGSASFAPFGGVHTIYFCGNYRRQAGADQIEAFCRARGFDCVSLTEEVLTDYGTMFLLPCAAEMAGTDRKQRQIQI